MTVSRKTLFYLGIFIGAVGAAGQSLLLHHELADTLPYKAMGIEFGSVYVSIARTGALTALIFSTIIAAHLGRKTLWLTMVAPVVLAPLIFAGVFQMYSAVYGMTPEPAAGDLTFLKAAEQFNSYCLLLIGLGFLVAIVLASVLTLIAKKTVNGQQK